MTQLSGRCSRSSSSKSGRGKSGRSSLDAAQRNPGDIMESQPVSHVSLMSRDFLATQHRGCYMNLGWVMGVTPLLGFKVNNGIARYAAHGGAHHEIPRIPLRYIRATARILPEILSQITPPISARIAGSQQ